MALTPEELERRKAHFVTRTAQYISLGYDRLVAPAFVLDAAGSLEGPVLDLGTGMGLMAREAARRGLEVVSADIAAEDQQVAAFLTDDPALASRIRFTLADGAALPFPNGYFGCAVTMDVLHHLADGAAVLKEVLRVVKPGGLVILGEFSAEGFALVSNVHLGEGRVHAEGPVTLDWSRGFLSGLGTKELALREGHLHRAAVLQTSADAGAPRAFAALDRPGLLRALDVFAKNWLAHDGCWFLAAEKRYGMETAMELDAASWRLFAAAEARRIMEAFSIPRGGGLCALEQALTYRMYSFINPYRVEWSEAGRTLRFFMEACRVQETRHRKGLPDFPCKVVGEVEFETFARTVDARIGTRCLHCPPDSEAHGHCCWEFRISGVSQDNPKAGDAN